MAEDESDPNGFVWANDVRENGHGHVVNPGMSGLPTERDSEDGVTTVRLQLPDELAEEVITLYDELDSEFYQRFGERMEPNQLFWAKGMQLILDNADELRKKVGVQ